MSEILTQEFQLVLGEIDDQQPTAGAHERGRLPPRPRRDRRDNAAPGETTRHRNRSTPRPTGTASDRCRPAAPDNAPGSTSQTVARNRQHLRADIDADGTTPAAPEFQHASGSGSGIKQISIGTAPKWRTMAASTSFSGAWSARMRPHSEALALK